MLLINKMMHPFTFAYRVWRRFFRYAERFAPGVMFNYGTPPGDSRPRFERFTQLLPFAVKDDWASMISAEDKDRLIAKADGICRHEFDLLGSGPYRFEGGIDWHCDFKSGFRWPKDVVHCHCRPMGGVDIKVPWELSRFNHAVTLGLAYRLTGDDKYSSEIINQVQDWIADNPLGHGVNWACCMDVAIRAANWLIGFGLCCEEFVKEEHASYLESFSASLWEHAAYIRSHLEWNSPHEADGANHLLSDLAALFALGLFFIDSEKGQRWFDFAHARIEEQMQKQVLSDGVHFERSPAYHRLCLEMFMWCGALSERASKPFSAFYYERIAKMQEFVADYMKPSGKASLIGDNDDGRFLSSGLLEMEDHSYLRPADPDGCFDIDRYLIDGSESVSCESSKLDAVYPEGGFYFLRDERAQVIVRAGRLAYNGSHAHNDQLSFELTLGGADIFVDRGSYLYTSDPELRDVYRGTAAHNVLQIDNAEQNSLSGPGLFPMPDETTTSVLAYSAGTVEARHRGFRSLSRPRLAHSRRYELRSDGLKIKDMLEHLLRDDVLSWRFHLAPGLTAMPDRDGVQILDSSGPVCRLRVSFPGDISVSDFAHSPSFGVLHAAECIQIEYLVSEAVKKESYIFRVDWGRR